MTLDASLKTNANCKDVKVVFLVILNLAWCHGMSFVV